MRFKLFKILHIPTAKYVVAADNNNSIELELFRDKADAERALITYHINDNTKTGGDITIYPFPSLSNSIPRHEFMIVEIGENESI